MNIFEALRESHELQRKLCRSLTRVKPGERDALFLRPAAEIIEVGFHDCPTVLIGQDKPPDFNALPNLELACCNLHQRCVGRRWAVVTRLPPPDQ